MSHDITQQQVEQRRQNGLEDVLAVAQVCDEYRGKEIAILDLTKVTTEFDYFVITTGQARRQMHAIADEVDRVMKERGSQRIGLEGYQGESSWVLQDYGNIVLHIFNAESRELYDLESLWADAQRVEWQSD